MKYIAIAFVFFSEKVGNPMPGGIHRLTKQRDGFDSGSRL